MPFRVFGYEPRSQAGIPDSPFRRYRRFFRLSLGNAFRTLSDPAFWRSFAHVYCSVLTPLRCLDYYFFYRWPLQPTYAPLSNETPRDHHFGANPQHHHCRTLFLFGPSLWYSPKDNPFLISSNILRAHRALARVPLPSSSHRPKAEGYSRCFWSRRRAAYR